jgi:hemolysin III
MMVSESYDVVSSFSHFATAIWAAFATLVLLRLTKGHGVGRWAIGFFGISMVLLYSASALFHGWRYATFEERLLFQKIDKSAVFLLIAGSYVPVVVYLLQGHWRRWTFAVVIGAALFGIGSMWLAPELPHEVLVGIYVLLGLSGLAPIRQYAAVAGWQNTRWAVGIISPYLGGAVIEVIQKPVLLPGWFGPHELMHFADTLGSIVYFAFLLKVLIRRPPLSDLPKQVTQPSWEATSPDLTRSGFVPAGM